MYDHFYRSLEKKALQTFPSLKSLEKVDWDHLVSPLELRLPRLVFKNAQDAVQALYRVSQLPGYDAKLEDGAGVGGGRARNRSVLMAYDFHTNEQGDCFLVEINTNASGFLLCSLMEMTHMGVEPGAYQPLSDLRDAFREESRLMNGPENPSIAITDDDLLEQKMYLEFLMYRDWFGSLGWPAEIVEGRDFSFDGRKIDLVYNRLTDFYLEEPTHAALRDAFLEGTATFSPNPREYWRLADKQRLVQFSEPGFLESVGASEDDRLAIQRVLIPTFEKSAWPSQDAIWSERRQLFFKPKRSFGGKSVYRGESVSRKVFERLMADDVLIQRFQPAQRVPVEDERSVLANWKFDLRFFVYGDRIQLAAARIYQGQVTNFSSPMGGYTRVHFAK